MGRVSLVVAMGAVSVMGCMQAASTGVTRGGAGGKADSTDETADALLTPEESKKVLSAIDSICADTWCKGDFGFEFLRFQCTASEGLCTLEFNYLWSTGEDEDPIVIPQSCEFGEFHGYVELMDEDELNEYAYGAVNACIRGHQTEALGKAQAQIAEKLLETCGTADASEVESVVIVNTPWDDTAVNDQLKALIAPYSPQGELTYRYADGFRSYGWMDDDACAAEVEKAFGRDFHAANLTVTNEGDEAEILTLVRWTPVADLDEVYELHIFEGYAN